MMSKTGRVQPQATRGASTHAQWRVIRCLHKFGPPFSAADIVRATELKQKKVWEFTALLAKAGVIKLVAHLGKLGGKRWRLARDLGPKTPVQRPGGLYDPNSGTLIPYQAKPKKEEK